MKFIGRTHQGRIRENNEDALAYDAEFGVAVLADGMGGLQAGELASQAAVDAVLEILQVQTIDAALVTKCVDLANSLGCLWTVVHAGYHFSGDVPARTKASLERLQRIAKYASDTGARVLLENLNLEPEHAEVHYLAHTVEECKSYFDAIPSERLGWAFTVNHSHLVPDGVSGFFDAFGIERIGEVRLADNTGEYEVHMIPGHGTLDFTSMLRSLESAGYNGHYSMAYGSPEEKIASRDWLVNRS